MARVKGGYLGGTYDIPKKQPLDSRMLVTKMADLINPSVWKTNGSTTSEFGHYNGMIVSVNSDGIYNGVYYLTDRTAITDENYQAYRTALASSEDISSYFSMWTKLGTLDDLYGIENKLKELIGDIPEGQTIADLIASVKPSVNLTPVDGTIIIADTEDGNKSIRVAVAQVAGNMLTAVDGGLFVPASSVKLADNTHGLVMVDGALSLNLATQDSDGAMSKEDKKSLDELKDAVAILNDICSWGEM
jgi:hypothetical protein